MPLLRFLAASAAIAAAFVLAAPSARADEDAEAQRLAARAGKALRYSVKTVNPANSIETGGAAILVNAPIEQVRAAVTDYRHYGKFIKAFSQARVISKKSGASEVYLEVPVMNGAAKVWAVVVMSAPAADGDGEKVVARYKKGNVDDFRAVWRLRKVDDQRTIVKLEILVDPKLPVPNSVVSPSLRSAADKAVTAIRNRVERGADTAESEKKPSNVAKR